MTALACLPMHGEVKMLREGLRTRDAHLMYWLSEGLGHKVTVLSRPEPWPRLTFARRQGRQKLPKSWAMVSPEPVALPPYPDARRWWVKSLRYLEPWPGEGSIGIVWNPIAGAWYLKNEERQQRILFDLLDNWLIHPYFGGIRGEVESAYRVLFDEAERITANSEATLELAQRFGRDDAVLIPNGCDPDVFAGEPLYQKNLTVGYGGKIGSRVDLGLIEEAVHALPKAHFEFAGPIMERKYRKALSRLPRVRVLGDVGYEDYPNVVRGWDVAWIPHRVGEGEVGGDAIKIYEFRAGGLPTVMPPLIGWQRAPVGVRVVEPSKVVSCLASILNAAGANHVPREPFHLSKEQTWQNKAELLLNLLGL